MSAVIRLDSDTPELAATYDRVGTRQFRHGLELVGLLRLTPGQRVLDVGCGTGLLGAWVADHLGPDGEVIGLDPLPLRVVLAARKHPRFSVSVGRAEDLSAFGDASFDAVYLNSVLHWIADQPKALGEARRVLKPGGRLAVNSADASRPHDANLLLRQVLTDLGREDDPSIHGGRNHVVDRAGLEALLAGAGFGELELQSRSFTDTIADVDELIAWSRSSSFGNWLSDLSIEDLAPLREGLQRRLEAHRHAGDGLYRVQRHLVFGSGRKA